MGRSGFVTGELVGGAPKDNIKYVKQVPKFLQNLSSNSKGDANEDFGEFTTRSRRRNEDLEKDKGDTASKRDIVRLGAPNDSGHANDSEFDEAEAMRRAGFKVDIVGEESKKAENVDEMKEAMPRISKALTAKLRQKPRSIGGSGDITAVNRVAARIAKTKSRRGQNAIRRIGKDKSAKTKRSGTFNFESDDSEDSDEDT